MSQEAGKPADPAQHEAKLAARRQKHALKVSSVWPENACVMPNSKSGVTKYVASKIRYNGFLK